MVSTNALELGIDIGALDVSVMAGYPGTIAATWQRAGRAGRRAARSAAVMVASSAPVDQFVVRHPSYFFDASPEHALVNPDNLNVLVNHVKCAAFELPFTTVEEYGRVNVQEVLGVLQEAGLVHLSGTDPEDETAGQWHWTSESYPADAVSLRSVSSDNFVVVDQTGEPKVIAETDFTSALSMLHPKAIYIVEGRLFQVERLDFEGRKAYVRSVDCDYYTTAIDYTRVTILDEFGCDAEQVAHHGEVHVVSRVVGFKKIKFHTNENVGSGELDLPEQQMHTTSYWLEVPAPVMAALPYAIDDRRDGVRGMAYAMKNVAQLLLMCDQRDVGLSVNAGDEPERHGVTPGASALVDAPRIFLYDAYPGGIGFSQPLFGMHAELLARTRALIDGCGCEHGCPTCVGPVGETGPLAKQVALRLLQYLGAAEPVPRLEPGASRRLDHPSLAQIADAPDTSAGQMAARVAASDDEAPF
ncbi:MAG: Zn-binding domain-containing protein [Vicinamibacterales bacterium]